MRVAIAEARAAFGLPEPGEAPGQQAWLDRPAPSASGIHVAGGPDAAALLVTGPWPVGILGLVAGRLADETGRPTIVGTVLATPGGDVVRASCRSDGRIDLAQALDACGDLFVRHGGHAAAADSSCRRTAGTRSSTGSSPWARLPRRRTRAARSTWTSPSRPGSWTTACTATSSGSRRAAPATPSRWWRRWA